MAHELLERQTSTRSRRRPNHVCTQGTDAHPMRTWPYALARASGEHFRTPSRPSRAHVVFALLAQLASNNLQGWVAGETRKCSSQHLRQEVEVQSLNTKDTVASERKGLATAVSRIARHPHDLTSGKNTKDARNGPQNGPWSRNYRCFSELLCCVKRL